jgi:hypothetical protein
VKHGIRAAVTAAGAFVLVSFSATCDKKTAARGGEWDSTDGPPAWIEAASGKGDVVRGVVAGQSNQLDLAGGIDEWVTEEMLRSMAWRLRPLLGEDADAVLDLELATTPFLRRAYHFTPPRRSEESALGAQTYTVWTRWEIPFAEIEDAIPQGKRDAALAALSAAEPMPPWSEVETKPEWAAFVPATSDTWTVTVAEAAERADVSRAQSEALSGVRVASSIAEALREFLGGELCWKAGNRAATWRKATHCAWGTPTRVGALRGADGSHPRGRPGGAPRRHAPGALVREAEVIRAELRSRYHGVNVTVTALDRFEFAALAHVLLAPLRYQTWKVRVSPASQGSARPGPQLAVESVGD